MKNPEIRFIDDNIDWQDENLSDALTERNTTSYKNNGLEHVSLTKDGVIPKSERYERDFLVTTKNKKYKITKINDICYNPANLKFGVICRNKYKDGIFSPIYITFETAENHMPNFVELIVTNPAFIRASLKYQEGTVYERMAVSPDNLLKMPISVPNIDFQEKIAKIFDNIDIKIKEEESLIQKLKDTKSALLIKMFPQENQSIPELRFDGFTNDWEQRKFGSLYQKSSEKNNGSIGIDKNITVATMQFKPDVKVTTEEYLKTYYTFNIGDIAFEGHHSKEFMFGRFVANDIGNGIVSHIFAVFRPYVNYDLKYWKYAVHNESIMCHILSRCTKASTMMHDLVTCDFLNDSILVPSIEEQRKIGAFLDNLDSLITLHQRKLDKLKEVKAALLEKLLV